MAPDPGHRASDADREAVSGVIRDAVADGRLGIDELDERLSAVWSARTYGELALTTTDLPVDLPAVLSGGAVVPGRSAAGPGPVQFAGRTQLDLSGGATTETTVAVFGSTDRRGSWTVPATLNAAAVFGGVELDLREATLTARETVIHAFALFGGITITVGEDVELVVNGAGILGGFQGSSSGIRRPGAPVVRVVGLALFGGVEVRQRPPRKALRGGRDAPPVDRAPGERDTPRLDRGPGRVDLGKRPAAPQPDPLQPDPRQPDLRQPDLRGVPRSVRPGPDGH